MQSRFLLITSISAWVSLMTFFTLFRSEWSPLGRTHEFVQWLGQGQYEDEEFSYQAVVESNGTGAGSNSTSYAEVKLEANNSTHPGTTLVLATMSGTDNTWLTTELHDQLGPASNLYTAIYVNDDTSAPHHTPANKGHETMTYLTYIIDYYTTLPAISIFLHGHPIAWHNNFLLDMSTSQMIRRLNRTKVLNDGYMNLRCQWGTGCPAHLYPKATEYDDDKPEELLVKDAWVELFPTDPLPEVLAQPCCSQFAVTSERIQRWPLERYVQFRQWLLETEVTDYMTGRFFEYFWQWIFNEAPVFCPDQRICYCEGYGICFEDPDDYLELFQAVEERDQYVEELKEWEEWTKTKMGERDIDSMMKREHATGGPDAAEEGQEARENWLKEKTKGIEDEISRRKQAALDAGKDPKRRLLAMEAARRKPIDVPEGKPPWWYK